MVFQKVRTAVRIGRAVPCRENLRFFFSSFFVIRSTEGSDADPVLFHDRHPAGATGEKEDSKRRAR